MNYEESNMLTLDTLKMCLICNSSVSAFCLASLA